MSDPKRVQLTLFEDPAEIIEAVRDGAWFSFETDALLGGRKLREGSLNGGAHWVEENYRDQFGDGGLCGEIARHGVATPITLHIPSYIGQGKVTLSNGHHRVACAADLGLLVPVHWYN